MATERHDNRQTTILAKNIHCPSCVSHIQKVLTDIGPLVHNVETKIMSNEVQISHHKSLPASELFRALSDAAFEVYGAKTEDDTGCIIQELGFEAPDDGWLEAASKSWRPSSLPSASPDQYLQLPDSVPKEDHIANCEACQEEAKRLPENLSEPVENSNNDLGTRDLRMADACTDPSDLESRRSSPQATRRPSLRSALDFEFPTVGPNPTQFEAIISIGGMTCASCTSAINHGLNELPYVDQVNVTLMTNSARVVFKGRENLQKIIDTIEDLGYDAAIERCSAVASNGEESQCEGTKRSIMLRIDGMFCKHCPARIVDAVNHRYPEETIDQRPTLKDPIMKFTYSPLPPNLTIRDIISTIDHVDEPFNTTIYTPPSIEQRSQDMQKHEQYRILIRLVLTFIIAIPTLLIGVIWMSLVPASNRMRMLFEQPAWSGTVPRRDWALFILATPVFFLAADVFHVRAIKEIRALWRRGSRMPVLQRFYRFGSMNLLISAGTSVAYIASVAVLGISARTQSPSSGSSSTYFDSVVFLTFFILIGRYLEAYSKAKTGNAVGMLGNLRPREAVLVTESVEPRQIANDPNTNVEKRRANNIPQSETRRIDTNLLEVGDVVIVSHGSSPPADGIIVEGSTKFNESSLTGEARAVPKQKNDTVFAGAINVGDPISIKVTRIGGSSMLDQIVAVVREGQTKRAPVERVVDVVTGYFVPVITALAIITFLVWFSLGQSRALPRDYLGSQQGGWAFWSLEFAIAVFVVACPCGIGLAAPTALFVGSGLAASHGILVRGGGEAFQEASNIDAVVFDKTGTLTDDGELRVTDHEITGGFPQIAWFITKSLEETSSHPLARALLDFASTRYSQQHQTISILSVSINEEPGLGLRGFYTIKCDGTSFTYEAALGSEALMSSINPAFRKLDYFNENTLSMWKSQGKSVALLALRQLPTPSSPLGDMGSLGSMEGLNNLSAPWKIAALFAISDPIRPSAKSTVSALQSRGIPVYMLTGDNPSTASAVASELSIPQDHVFAGVLPTEKSSKIRYLQEQGPRRFTVPPWLSGKRKERATIAFVGDGINDAPALTAADVSISLSSASDIAVNSSSFILLSSSLDSVITLFDLSARVFRRVKFNFLWAVVYNILLVPIAAGVLFRIKKDGWRLGPVWGSAAMALSSLCVVISSLALRWEGGWRLDRIWKR
ncbi:hypothetical protein MMC28_007190 [Mycoblastus sanguinarius]|nr:hypothetical protein [Mycoblastus sanguinarius]